MPCALCKFGVFESLLILIICYRRVFTVRSEASSRIVMCAVPLICSAYLVCAVCTLLCSGSFPTVNGVGFADGKEVNKQSTQEF